MTTEIIPGLNIQWPWSQMILDLAKSIETRSYPLPVKYIGKELAIIETPGALGKKEGISSARIVGTVVFIKSFQYETFEQWASDYSKHLVPVDNAQFSFQAGQEKWGWVIGEVKALRIPRPAPAKRGIVFASECQI